MVAIPDPTHVRPERTGWRDEKISERHRMWGFNCPAVDLDFLMVEYNLGKPVGLIEYKHDGAQMPNLKHPTYRALTELANLAGLPFFIAFYHNEDWWFRIVPVNDLAKEVYVEQQAMSELEFVTSLYQMRRLVIEREVIAKLKTIQPPGAENEIHPAKDEEFARLPGARLAQRTTPCSLGCGRDIEADVDYYLRHDNGDLHWAHELCVRELKAMQETVSDL